MLKKEEIFVEIQSESEYNKFIKLLRSFDQEFTIKGWDRDERCAHFYKNHWCVPLRSYIERFKTKVSIQELKNILAFEYLKKGDVIIFSGGTAGLLWIAEFEHFASNRCIDLPLSIKAARYNALHKESRYHHSASAEIHGSFVRFATDGEKRVLGVKTDPTQSSFECDCSGLVDHINRLGNDINNIPALIKASIHPSIGSVPMYYKGNKIEKGSVIYINSDGHPELYESKEDFFRIPDYGNFHNEVKINEEWPVKPQVFKKDQIIESLNDAYKSMADSCTLETMFVRNALSSVMDYITAIPDITTYDIAKIERLHDYLIDAHNIHPSFKQLAEAREVILKLSKYTDHE